MTYSNRGNAYSRLGDYQQAIKDCNRAIQLNPDYVMAYYNMASIYSLQGNTDMACQWLKQAIGKGYKNWEYLKTDRDFDSIRNTSCFREIIKPR
jgi:tetratricopeptide (TPR) repeat protein